MDEQTDREIAGKKQRDQMLKLVAKSFYNELTNYGVSDHEIINMASHLLDNLLAKEKKPAEGVEYYNGIFTVASVRDDWADCKQLAVQHVTLRPLQLPDVSKIGAWLKVAAVRESFCSFFEAEVTSMFIRFSMLTCVRSRPCERGSACWVWPHTAGQVETNANAKRRVYLRLFKTCAGIVS